MSSTAKLSTLSLAIQLLKDPDRKSIFKIACEVVWLWLLSREVPRHYFSRYLFKKSRKNVNDYLPDKFLYRIKPYFNEKRAREVVENKLYFDFFYSQFNIPLPKIKMFNHRNMFVKNGSCFEVNSVNEFKQPLEKLFQERSLDSIFIKKTYWSYGGENIFKITLDDLLNLALIEKVYSEVIKTGYLFQETVKQHAALNVLNPSCLNTMRFDTFIDKNGNVEIISAYFKTNVKNNYIDNETTGGCEIPIDLATGKLGKEGHLTLKFNGLHIPTSHPVTKVVFENFQVPYFAETCELVLKVARYVPNLRLMGWDVAISEQGPVLIEGNSDYDISASDLAYHGYKRNKVFQKVMKEINLL